MTLITDPVKLRQALQEIKPSRIAVAYVGGWDQIKDLVVWTSVKSLVVQASASTNVESVRNIAQLMQGKQGPLLHDTLHAKIYLGAKEALIGSANLSGNGFPVGGTSGAASVVGTREACWLVKDPEGLKAIGELLDEYEAEAERCYPDKVAREKCLERMEKDAARRALAGFDVAVRNLRSQDFLDYLQGERKPFTVEWWHDDMDKDEAKLDELESDGTFSNGLALKAPLPKVGSWILCWRCDEKGYPLDEPGLAFMRVDERAPSGVYVDQGADYPQSVVELKPLEPELQPFRIDEAFTRAFVEVLSGKVVGKHYRPKGADDAEWHSSRYAGQEDGFLEELEAAYRKGG